MPAAELVERAAELRGLLQELADQTGGGGAWGMRALRRNVELALLSPRILESAVNQLDFIQELAEAVRDAGGGGFQHAPAPAATPEGAARREAGTRAVLGRLDELAHQLRAAAEAWRDAVAAAAEAAGPGGANPQEEHSS